MQMNKNIVSVINNTIINARGITPIKVAGETIASIQCSSAGKHIYVNYIAVSDKYRNRGVASSIVGRLLSIYTDKDVGALCYDTSFGVFERCGFVNYSSHVSRVRGKYHFHGTRSMIYKPK